MSQISNANPGVRILNQGALLQEFQVAGSNLVLSFPSAEPYTSAPYFSETIGRVANRIKNAEISDLNGRSYQLAPNEGGKHHLHGGTHGWGHKMFSGPRETERHGRPAFQYTYVSPDGEEGYPGTVELRVWYAAHEEQDGNILKSVLEIEYEVELIGNECDETVVNITNHSYFNIGAGATIEGTVLDMATTSYQCVDDESLPTEKIASYPGIEAGKAFVLGAKEPSIDHCFVFDPDYAEAPPMLDTRKCQVRRLISAYHPSTRIHLDILSTEPAFQVYTGDGVNVAASEHGPALRSRAGFCVEPSRFINAVNVPKWKPQVLLRKNQLYGSKIIYKAWQA